MGRAVVVLTILVRLALALIRDMLIIICESL
jgi:hypothetical protein